jgi:AraC-like DNA-binding protein
MDDVHATPTTRRVMSGHGASVEEACTAVGYQDVTFFGRLFKRHTGVSPAAYRSQFAGMTFDRGERPAREARP